MRCSSSSSSSSSQGSTARAPAQQARQGRGEAASLQKELLHNQKFQLQQQQVEQLGIAKPAAAPPVQAMRRCTSRCISSNRNSNKACKRRRKRRREHRARGAAPAASWFFYSARSRHEIAAKAAAQQNADSHFLRGKWAESTAIFVDWRLQRAEKEAPVVGITP